MLNTGFQKHLFYGTLLVLLFLGTLSAVFRTDLEAKVVTVVCASILFVISIAHYVSPPSRNVAFGVVSRHCHLLGSTAILPPMAHTQQTFTNSKDGPIYVSVEPWPECFELEPGDKLTLIWDASTTGDAMQVDFINEHELVVWPDGAIDDIKYLFNGEPGRDRSWTFKHR